MIHARIDFVLAMLVAPLRFSDGKLVKVGWLCRTDRAKKFRNTKKGEWQLRKPHFDLRVWCRNFIGNSNRKVRKSYNSGSHLLSVFQMPRATSVSWEFGTLRKVQPPGKSDLVMRGLVNWIF